MKSKLLASLILASTLSSCSIGQVPHSSFQIPPSLSIELGSDGCPIEEPCWDYEAEAESMEAAAWAAFDSYNFAPVDLPYPIQQEYIGWTDESDPELSEGFWSLPDPNDHDVVYIFHSVALTTM